MQVKELFGYLNCWVALYFQNPLLLVNHLVRIHNCGSCWFAFQSIKPCGGRLTIEWLASDFILRNPGYLPLVLKFWSYQFFTKFVYSQPQDGKTPDASGDAWLQFICPNYSKWCGSALRLMFACAEWKFCCCALLKCSIERLSPQRCSQYGHGIEYIIRKLGWW